MSGLTITGGRTHHSTRCQLAETRNAKKCQLVAAAAFVRNIYRSIAIETQIVEVTVKIRKWTLENVKNKQ